MNSESTLRTAYVAAAIAKSGRSALLTSDQVAQLSVSLCRARLPDAFSAEVASALKLLDLSATLQRRTLTLRDGAGRVLAVVTHAPTDAPAAARASRRKLAHGARNGAQA